MADVNTIPTVDEADIIPEDQKITEPEIIDEEISETEDDAESLSAVQGLVQRLSDQLDTLVQKQKEVSNMLKSVFENDDDLTKAQNEAKVVTKNLKDRQTYLNETQEVKDLKIKLADIRDDIKMVQESLDTHLLNYYQMTSAMSFPTADGSEREYALKAKLKPKKRD
jgi:phage-related tail protein